MADYEPNELVKFLRAVMAPLTVPIREFMVGVGHSTVASTAILGFCAVACVTIWSFNVREIQNPAAQALTQERLARARSYELANQEKEAKSPERQWSLLALIGDEDGISLEFEPLEGATAIRLSVIISGQSLQKVVKRDVTPGGVVSVRFTKEELAPAWMPTGMLLLTRIEQVTTDGVSVYVGPRKAYSIPPEV